MVTRRPVIGKIFFREKFGTRKHISFSSPILTHFETVGLRNANKEEKKMSPTATPTRSDIQNFCLSCHL